MPERRRSGTAKINTLTSAIADVAPVEKRLMLLAQPRLTCRRQSMSEAYSGGSTSGAIHQESGHAPALGAAGWLGLAAAPTFAIMALLTSVLGGGPADMLCSAAPDASLLSGMVPMYLLMSAFHSAPWLKLISSRRTTILLSRPWAKLGRNLSKTSAPSPAGRMPGEKT
jgi:hypothetical protein